MPFSQNPAQETYRRNLALQQGFGRFLKRIFVDPIPWLAKKGYDASMSITQPSKDVSTADRVMAASLLGEPGAVGPVDWTDQEVRDTSSMMKGAVGGAVEGLSEIPSPADVATLGLSLAARQALKTPKRLGRIAEVVPRAAEGLGKVAKVIDESSNLVNAGLGAADIAEGVSDRDPAKIGAGLFQAGMGTVGHLADRTRDLAHVADLPEVGPRAQAAEVATPDLTVDVDKIPRDPTYTNQLVARFKGTQAHQDFTNMIEDIRDRLAVHFSNIPPEKLGTHGVTVKPVPWEDGPPLLGEELFGTPAERMANTKVGTVVDLRKKERVGGALSDPGMGPLEVSTIRGIYEPESWVQFRDRVDPVTGVSKSEIPDVYYNDVLNKMITKGPHTFKKGEIRTAPIAILQQMALDLVDHPHLAETLQTPQDLGREFVRRTYSNILHELTHAVDATTTHTPKNIDTWDPLNEKYIGDAADIHRNKQFTALQSLVRDYMAGALDTELMGQYGSKLAEHLPTIEQFGAHIAPPSGVARIPSPFMERAGGPRGLAAAADRGGGFGGGGAALPSEAVARHARLLQAGGLPAGSEAHLQGLISKGYTPMEATLKLKKIHGILTNQGLPPHVVDKAIGDLVATAPAKGQRRPPVGAPPTQGPGGPVGPPPQYGGPGGAYGTPPPPSGPRVKVPRPSPNARPAHGYESWVNARAATQIEGANARKKFEDMSAPNIQQILDFNANPQANPRFKDVQDHLDKLYAMQRAAGVNIGFKENYLPQMWKETPQQVYAAYRRLGIRPSHTMTAVFRNYADGIAAGLTPKFDNIADLVGMAESKARKALADRMFYNYLKQNHLVKPANSAPPDWVTINPDAFPLHRFKQGKLRVITNVKAPPEMAFRINQYLDPQTDSFLRQVADKATDVKNVVMSSGIPLTSLNAHGFNMLTRIYGIQSNPVSGALETIKQLPKFVAPQLFKGTMDRALAEAPRFIKKGMTFKVEEHPFKVDLPPLRQRLKEASDFMRPGSGQQLRPFHGLREIHKALFEDPLFQKFIPMIKVEYAIKMESELLKRGVMPEEATTIAAHWMNEAFGGINVAEALGRPVKGMQFLSNKITGKPIRRSNEFQNFLRISLNAPDWAESNLKLAGGVLRGLKNPKDPKFMMYRNVIQNVAAFYLMSSVVQKLTNGHYLHENPEGRKMSIAAGSTAQGRERYLHPASTGWDFAKIPYEVIDKIAHGDLSGVSKVLAYRLHPMARAAIALATNRDYLGRQILGGNQPYSKQAGNVAEVISSVAAPSYIREPIEAARSRKKGPEEAIMQSLEMPVRYSSEAPGKVAPVSGAPRGGANRKGPRRTRPLRRR